MNGETVVESFDPVHAVLAASRSPLAAEFERSMQRAGHGTGVAMVAVSGGPDSIALLLLAHALTTRRKPPIFERVIVGHVDHGLRPEGEREAELVRRLADRLGCPFVMERLEWPTGTSVSSAEARDARWAALHRLAVRQKTDTILCGHHADDQAETVVLRLARGAGLQGIAGIPESRELQDGVRIVRPLLRSPRRDVLDLIQASGVSVVDDPTNRRRDVARGVVRHDVLPRLEGVHPGAAGRIAALAEEVRSMVSGPGRGLGAVGPRPESIRWSRRDFQALDESAVAGRLREVVRMSLGAGVETGVVESIPRATWKSIARAVLDDEVRPRDFELAGLARIRVDVGSIECRFRNDPSQGSSTLSS